MNRRLRGIIGLTTNYIMLIAFGFVFAYGMNYVLNGMVDTTFLIVTLVIINTITTKHMRAYWVDVALGDRKQYPNHRPGFTDEILDAPQTKKVDNSDLNELLKAATKKPTDNSSLKRNPLDD